MAKRNKKIEFKEEETVATVPQEAEPAVFAFQRVPELKAISDIGTKPKSEPTRKSAGYMVQGDWKGYPVYKCDKCDYQSINFLDMEKHVKEHDPVMQFVDSRILGSNGMPIRTMVEAPMKKEN